MNLTKLLIIGAVAAILIIPGGQFITAGISGPSGGDDYLIGNNGKDRINAQGGDDQIWGLGGPDDLKGGGGDDHISGGDGDDKINGGADNDTISGEDGNDDIDGGSGDDKINGDKGHDLIDAGTGNDVVDGGDGNDNIKGGSGDDNLFGNNGNDAISGKAGNDNIDGGDGDDDLFADDGDDTLFGNEGDDTLTGGLGQNDLDGGNGNEVTGDTCNWDGGPTFVDGNGIPGIFDPTPEDGSSGDEVNRDDTIVNCEITNVIDPVAQGGGPPTPPPAGEDTDFDPIIDAINAAKGNELKKKDKGGMLATLESSKTFFAALDATNGCAELVVFEGQVNDLHDNGLMADSLHDDLVVLGGLDLLEDLEVAKGC